MSAATAHQAAVRMREHLLAHNKDRASLIFHGGEPLLGGRAHIELLLDEISRVFSGSGIELSIGLQTNLLLFDEDIGELLRSRNISVGVSIDGPPRVNDKHRLDHKGRGTTNLLLRKLSLITSDRFRPIFSGFLSVIESTSDPKEIIDFLCSFSPPSMDFLLPLDNHERLPSGMKEPCQPSAYGTWLKNAFDHWLTLRPPVPIRMFNTIIGLLCGAPAQVENLGLTPVDLIVIETNGEIEGVDSLKGAAQGVTALGYNVCAHTFDTVATHPLVKARQVGAKSLSETCQKCDLLNICGGGYIPHRFSKERGFDNPSVYCADLYSLIKYIYHALTIEVEAARGRLMSESPSRYRDNGFESSKGMRKAHEPIVQLAQRTLAGRKGVSVLDLGCGNGMLLREIALRTTAVPVGIEANATRAKRAKRNLQQFGGKVINGDMFKNTLRSNKDAFDLVLVPANALFAAPPTLRNSFTTDLKAISRSLIVYGYDDDAKRLGEFEQIAENAGLRLVGSRPAKMVSLAEFLDQP